MSLCARISDRVHVNMLLCVCVYIHMYDATSGYEVHAPGAHAYLHEHYSVLDKHFSELVAYLRVDIFDESA